MTYLIMCYFRDLTYQNHTRINNPPDQMMTQRFTDKSECFDIKLYHHTGGKVGEAGLQFGGPGVIVVINSYYKTF